MVVAALCIPCMTAAASTGPVAPLVLGAAVGYYSLKKSNKKNTKKKIPGKKVFPKTKSKNKIKKGINQRKKSLELGWKLISSP